MKIKVSKKRCLVWDREIENMVVKWSVEAFLLGNGDCVLLSVPVLYVDTLEDVKLAKNILVSRIREKWNRLKTQ